MRLNPTRVLLVPVVVGIAACGSDSGTQDASTADDASITFGAWQAEVVGICESRREEFLALETPESAEGLDTYIEVFVEESNDMRRTIEAVDVPEEDADAIEEWLDNLEAQADIGSRMVEMLGEGDNAVVQSLMADSEGYRVANEALVTDLGVEVCSAAVPLFPEANGERVEATTTSAP